MRQWRLGPTRVGRIAGAAAALLLAAAPGPARAAPSAPPRATALFRLSDPQLSEVSGIAAGIRSPGVVYVENDSGDQARFFALDARTGKLLAQYAVPGATNVDWEDIAVAPDADGTPSVWLADVGDNDARRQEVRLYRVDEPRVPTNGDDADRTSAPPQVWRLRYPGGARAPDAESLAVTPSGVPYVVTKSVLGDSVVYAATDHPGAQSLRKVGAIRFSPTGTAGPFGPFGQVAATGADISRGGSRLVVRTYTDAYLWPIGDGGVAAALRRSPRRIALPEQPQGEGVCFSAGRLLVDSEGVGSTVYAVRVPPAPANPASAPAAPSTAPSTTAPTATAPPTDDAGSARAGAVRVLAAVAAAIALGVVAAAARRRRGRRD